MTINTAPRIKFDRAWRSYRDGESVVVTCSSCGLKWAALALTREQARRAAEQHQEDTHGILGNRARQARYKADSRARTASTRR